MDDATGRDIPGWPTVLLRVEAEINVIEVREIAFVEQTDFSKHFAADHHARARNPVGLESVVDDGGRHDPTCEHSGHQAQLEASFEFPKRRLKAEGRSLGGAVWVLQTTAGNPYGGVL